MPKQGDYFKSLLQLKIWRHQGRIFTHRDVTFIGKYFKKYLSQSLGGISWPLKRWKMLISGSCASFRKVTKIEGVCVFYLAFLSIIFVVFFFFIYVWALAPLTATISRVIFTACHTVLQYFSFKPNKICCYWRNLWYIWELPKSQV